MKAEVCQRGTSDWKFKQEMEGERTEGAEYNQTMWCIWVKKNSLLKPISRYNIFLFFNSSKKVGSTDSQDVVILQIQGWLNMWKFISPYKQIQREKTQIGQTTRIQHFY